MSFPPCIAIGSSPSGGQKTSSLKRVDRKHYAASDKQRGRAESGWIDPESQQTSRIVAKGNDTVVYGLVTLD
jgi:hypothetical protein